MKKIFQKIMIGIVGGTFYGFMIALCISFYYHLSYLDRKSVV